jgi:hypothetical protein
MIFAIQFVEESIFSLNDPNNVTTLNSIITQSAS